MEKGTVCIQEQVQEEPRGTWHECFCGFLLSAFPGPLFLSQAHFCCFQLGVGGKWGPTHSCLILSKPPKSFVVLFSVEEFFRLMISLASSASREVVKLVLLML